MTDWAAFVTEQTPMALLTAWRILGHRQDAEDVVQDALLVVLRAQRQHEVRNLGGFLRVTVTCRALDRLRKRRIVELVPDYVAAANSDGPEQRAEANELAAWLRAAVAMLPARSAQVFSLSCFAELSHAEIAAELSISSDAVGVALHRARANIAEMYHKAANTCGGSKHD